MNVKQALFWISVIVSHINSSVFLESKLITALELASLFESMHKMNFVSEGDDFRLQKIWETKANSNGVIFLETLNQGYISKWPKGVLTNGISWNVVADGDAANCGYYALKNVLFLMNAFKQDSLMFFDDLRSEQAFFDCMKIWAPIIYQHRNFKAPINNLIGGEIDMLLEKLNQLKKIPRFSSIDVDLDIVVIENQDLEVITGFVNEAIYQSVKKLAQENKGMFGVIQNTGGHWISFVVYKKESIQKIFYMDSCNVCMRKDCSDAVAVFTKDITEIDKIIFNNQKLQMKESLSFMTENAQALAANDLSEHFDPVDKIHTIFTHILVSWQNNNQAAFDIVIQKQIFAILENVLNYLNQHHEIYKLINWNEFGVGNVRSFNSFNDVIDAVLLRVPDIDESKKINLEKKYLEPLLKLS